MRSRKNALASALGLVAVAASIFPALGAPCLCVSVSLPDPMNVVQVGDDPFTAFFRATQEVSVDCSSGSPSECGTCINFYSEWYNDFTHQWVNREYYGAVPGGPFFACGSTGNTQTHTRYRSPLIDDNQYKFTFEYKCYQGTEGEPDCGPGEWRSTAAYVLAGL